jgi:predicted nucleic acid-binding protein
MPPCENTARNTADACLHRYQCDADDNKFANCAIVAHADFIITEDKHFAPLANAGYKPQPISALEFIERYLNTV